MFIQFLILHFKLYHIVGREPCYLADIRCKYCFSYYIIIIIIIIIIFKYKHSESVG